MNKNVLKVAFVAAIAMIGGINVFNAQKPIDLSDVAMANVEALAQSEDIEGLLCYYYGTENYEDRIPCSAKYPNIGPCGERERAFFSDNKAQCAKN